MSWRLLDGEAVIVSPVSGEVRVLNAVGTEIYKVWQMARPSPKSNLHLYFSFPNADR
ncbi:MAG: hypothetical protein M5U34_07540 [Chloroflexi bacterium]|nr:hypothetical protein [Chloroflexota bacterium]